MSIADMFGTVVECPHEKESFGLFATKEDAQFLIRELGLPPGDSVRICWACYDRTPEAQAKRAAEQARHARAEAVAEEARQEMLSSGEPLLECPCCEEIFYAEEACEIRYCTHCELSFVAEERNCENCNRPFTRLLTKVGHEQCAQDWDEDTGDCTKYVR